MSSLQVHNKIVSRLQLQIENPKMSVGHSYILCHLNCKCYLVNMTTTIVACSTNIGANKITMMKIYSFSLKDPNNSILKTIELINDLSKTFKS